LPKEPSDAEKTGWYHDLHWLLNQGYVLLMADSTIHRAKKPGPDEPKRATKKTARKKSKQPPKRDKTRVDTEATPAPASSVEERAQPCLDSRTSGLYALSGRKLGGSQHEAADLHTRGLRPRCNRPVEDEPESEGDSELPI
ncbi:MAG: hypothetical protein HRU37_10670, partial [Roseibacillus sp.]|nr:hypothetical protein [Roseibacillus sp.]